MFVDLLDLIWSDFNPRSPCGERLVDSFDVPAVMSFQSTLSLRRATSVCLKSVFSFGISIHALLAESDRFFHDASWRQSISIHALLAESDPLLWMFPAQSHGFQSTLSLRRATRYGTADNVTGVFQSTLSLRRATQIGITVYKIKKDFNPRSPCGERHGDLVHIACYITFQSTLSLRRATCLCRWSRYWACISIHALLAESDVYASD